MLEFIALTNMDAFDAFLAANPDVLETMTIRQAFMLACNQELFVGGSATPLFRVGFMDE